MTKAIAGTRQTISYPLPANGYLNQWLVAGPQAIAVPDLTAFDRSNLKAAIVQAYHNHDLLLPERPAEADNFVLHDAHGDATLPWHAVTCGDDHFVNVTAFYHNCHYLRTWAYTEVISPATTSSTLALTTNGPADVWVNGVHVHRHLHFEHQIAQSVSLEADLREGANEILVCFEAVAIRECPYLMALQITAAQKAERSWQIQLPTTLPLDRRQTLETIFRAATVDRTLYHREDEVIVRWPADLKANSKIGVRLQTPGGRIYAEGHPTVKAGEKVNLGKAYTRPDGDYLVTLMPDPQEYYEHNVRILRHIPIRIANGKFSEATAGTYAERRQEALTAAIPHTNSIYSEIAKMALGQWSSLNLKRWTETIDHCNQRADCSDFYLIGMLGALLRFGDDPNFPAELKAAIEECALQFKYWMDEPGDDAMCYWSENHQILFHACEVLAGQLYSEKTFTNVQQTGEWHQQKGEQLAVAWLQKRASGGFREWDSNTYFEHDVLALSHLADLAADDTVAEMSAIVLDKLFFTMAVNSFRGIFGSTHGRTYSPFIKGGRLEPTSGIAHLLWGVGGNNSHILGSVSLACAESYELPPAIYEIGATPVEEMWNKERHAGTLEMACDCAEGEWAIDKVTYKTADYMLSSAQDYRSGEAGYQQHIWQATMGPDAVVFVNHPPCVSEEGSHRPNFWHGNVVLPRVAQWQDLLIAIHRVPEDDWLGFTHAYFPTLGFDEYQLRGGWAFARRGDGYLALRASSGMELVTNSAGIQEELRAHGPETIWICQMGRAAQDGSFAEFQEKVVALPVTVDGLTVNMQSLRGDQLRFGWTGPLLRNGVEEAITGFKHYDNPFCSCELDEDAMVIRSWNHAMQLDFSGV